MKCHFRSLLALLPAAARAIGTINNSGVKESITNAAIPLDTGKYTMQNVQTGEFINYNNNNGRQMFPQGDADKASPILFTSQKLDGQPYSIISASDSGGEPRCLSAQWWYSDNGTDVIGGNFLGVLYTCGIGSFAQASTVRDAKQQWYIVPVVEEENVDLSQGVKEAKGKAVEIHEDVAGALGVAAPREPIEEKADEPKKEVVKDTPVEKKELAAKPSPQPTTTSPERPTFEDKATKQLKAESVPSSASRISKCSRKLRKRDLPMLERSIQPLTKFRSAVRRRDLHQSRQIKRAPKVHAYYIITEDHLADMQTRALTGTVGNALGTTTKSTSLTLFDKSTLQQWILTPVK